MSKNKDQIQHEVERTLGSLDGMQRAEANPYLFTKVRSRLQQQRNIWNRGLEFISRPAIAFIIIIAVCINALIFFEAGPGSTQQGNQGEQQFATDYNLMDNSVYESTTEPE